MSKRKHDESQQTTTSSTTGTLELFESTPIHDRSSKFIAIFTPSTSSPRSLQRHPPFESAMHKILAWRKPSTQKSLAGSFGSNTTTTTSRDLAKSTLSQESRPKPPKVVLETGSDEDGERWAGKKLEKVLTDLDVQGTVVVARWYGGTMLGPVRFKWIEDSAREAVQKWKASTGSGSLGGSNPEVKRAKIDGEPEEDDPKLKEGVARVLRERDASINVLRSLLAEKNAELQRKQAGEDEQKVEKAQKQDEVAKNPSTASMDYNTMPLARLKQMEKARDATLAWILKQIDLVEEKIVRG